MSHRLVIGAIDRKTKMYTHPADGNKEDEYFCSVCSEDVILKKGTVRIPHFAHKRLSDCSVFEVQQDNQTHLIAQVLLKQLLERTNVVIEQTCERCANSGERVVVNQINIPMACEGYSVLLEHSFIYEGHPRRADLAYLNSDGQIQYIFEIYNTHKTDPLIRPEPWFEFDAKEVIKVYNEEVISVSSGEIRLQCIRSLLCDQCEGCLCRENNISMDAFTQKPNIYFNQRGAGCGKTYESVQLINNLDDFSHKEIFIYLTKVHSAKYVIYKEFVDQMNRGSIGNLERIWEDDIGAKQIKLNFRHTRYNKNITVLIGTIDSFTYAMADHTKLLTDDSDYFKNIVNTINAGYMSVKNNKVYYSGSSRDITQKCLIIIDEAQDLNGVYIEAFDKIIERTNSDVYIIGDKLQSIYGEQNIYTYSLDKLSTQCVISEGINVVKRFHHSGLMSFVNGIVPFNKYGLPPITGICDGTCRYIHEEEKKSYEAFSTVDYFCSKDDPAVLDATIQDILQRVNSEVVENNYLPHNFMFVFPLIKNNMLASRLTLELQFYWAEKFEEVRYRQNVLKNHEYWKDKSPKECYTKTAFWHKSENGQPIDLTQSEYATRLLSIHASKGNGCEVVFVLGLTESTLKCFSNQQINLTYESLLHVAITRQKKKLYFGTVLNNDDIHQRISRVCPIVQSLYEQPNIYHVNKSINLQIVVDDILKNSILFNQIKTHIIDTLHLEQYIPIQSINDANIIDFGHHIIRRCIMDYYYTQHIATVDCHDQLYTVQRVYFCESNVEQRSKEEYITHLKQISDGNKKKLEGGLGNAENYIVPVLNYTQGENTIRQYYSSWLVKIINNISQKISVGIRSNTVPAMCMIECVVYSYVYNIMKDGIFIKTATMYEVFNIMDSLNNVFIVDEEHTDTFRCNCRQWVGYKKNKLQKIDMNGDYNLCWFYSKVHHISNVFQKYTEKLNEMNIHRLKYNKNHQIGIVEAIDFRENVHTIGYNDTTVVYHLLEPTFNALNSNKVFISVLLTHFILCNQNKLNGQTQNKNYARYNGKTIYACIFTFSSNEPIFIPLDITPHMETIRIMLRSYLETKYRSYSSSIYHFYKFFETTEGSMKSAVTEVCLKLSRSLCKIRRPKYIDSFFTKMENLFEEADNEDDQEEACDATEKKYNTQAKFEKRLDAELTKMLNNIYYLTT